MPLLGRSSARRARREEHRGREQHASYTHIEVSDRRTPALGSSRMGSPKDDATLLDERAAPRTDTEAPPAPPVLGGRYEVLGLLGVGGMGAVYRVRDRELDEEVALKMLRPE